MHMHTHTKCYAYILSFSMLLFAHFTLSFSYVAHSLISSVYFFIPDSFISFPNSYRDVPSWVQLISCVFSFIVLFFFIRLIFQLL